MADTLDAAAPLEDATLVPSSTSREEPTPAADIDVALAGEPSILGMQQVAGPPYKLLFATVFCLAVLPDFANSTIFSDVEAFSLTEPLGSDAYLLIRSLQVLLPTLLLMRLLPWGWSFYGVVRFEAAKDLPNGCGLAIITNIAEVIFLLLAAALVPDFYESDFADVWVEQQGAEVEADAESLFDGASEESGSAAQRLAAVAGIVSVTAIVANSVAEEFAIRGLLLPVLLQRFGSRFWAVALSSALFASYHVYQGYLGMITAFIFGAIYGGYFIRRGRIWPLVVGHTAANLWYTYG